MQPTPEQIRELEKAHKVALENLLQAIRFRYIIFDHLGSKNETYQNYANFIYKLWKNWYARQMQYEKAGAPKENILQEDWLTKTGQAKLNALLRKWDMSGKGIGIGFIPLLIWAVIAIAGFFTAEKITDELTTTTEEQESLMKTSQDICAKNHFSPDECKAFMTQQSAAVESSNPLSQTTSLAKWGLLAVGGYFAFKLISEHKTSKTT